MKNIVFIALALVVWSLWWLSSQALFIITIPFLTDWLTQGSATQSFISITLFLLVPTAIVSLVYRAIVHDYSFLRTRKQYLLLYLIPLVLFIRLLTLGSAFGIPAWIYGLGMIVSAFVQDLVTFGYLQTYLEKRMVRILAAIVVGLTFFVGHFTYGLAYSTLFYILGFLVFALVRYKLRSVYATNVLHLSFLLLV